MKMQDTMFRGLVNIYLNDDEHRIDTVGNKRGKYAFISLSELTKYYGRNGFSITPNKYTKSAMDKHIDTWEILEIAERCTRNGIDGIAIDLGAVA